MIRICSQFIFYIKIFQRYLGLKIYFSFFLIAIAGLAESTSISLFPLVLNSINNNQLIIKNNILNFLFTNLKIIGFNDDSIIILLLICFFFILKGIFTFFAYSYAAFLRGELIIKFKEELLNGYSNMKYEYYIKNNIGNLVNIINEQSNRSVDAFKSLYDVGLKGITCFIYLLFAFSLSFSMGFLILLSSFLIFYLFKKINTSTKRMSLNTSTENSNIAKLIIEFLNSFKYLKSTNQIQKHNAQIYKSIKKLSFFHKRTGILGGIVSAGREPISISLIIFIFVIEIYLLNSNFEALFATALLYYRSLTSIVGVQGSWQNLQQLVGSNDVLFNKIKSLNRNFEYSGKTSLKKFKKGIKFLNVSFKYDTKRKYIFENLNLDIKANSYTAFIGKSGSGKSTLADLITLINRPNMGEIFIDDIDSTQLDLNSWRDQIGYVSQETVIFDDSIANNISQQKNKELNEYQIHLKIKKAACLASIDEFIESLPEGYNTLVGEKGIKISGGQKQRLFIARELFRMPKLLILDEATSALDSQSEFNIQKSLDKLKGSITIIIIAHRLSTIKNVDNIIILDKRGIIEEGSFKELTKSRNSYLSKLITNQNINL